MCREWVDEVYISLPYETHYLQDLISDISEMGIIVHQELLYSTNNKNNLNVIENIAGKTVEQPVSMRQLLNRLQSKEQLIFLLV